MDRRKKNEIYRNSAPNPQELAALIRKAQGQRTGVQYAAELGIDKATLSRISNSRRSCGISNDLIEKIYETAADESGVTLELLLSANGMALPADIVRRSTSSDIKALLQTFLQREYGLCELRTARKFSCGPFNFSLFDFNVCCDDRTIAYVVLPQLGKGRYPESIAMDEILSVLSKLSMAAGQVKSPYEIHFVTNDSGEFGRIVERFNKAKSIDKTFTHLPVRDTYLDFFDGTIMVHSTKILL